jgi:hypothetical protein
MESEDAREAIKAKQATDLHTALVDMLVPIRTCKNLLNAINDLAEAHSNSATANTSPANSANH